MTPNEKPWYDSQLGRIALLIGTAILSGFLHRYILQLVYWILGANLKTPNYAINAILLSMFVFLVLWWFRTRDTHAQIEETKQNTLATRESAEATLQAVINNHKNEIRRSKLNIMQEESGLINDAILIASQISQSIKVARESVLIWDKDRSHVVGDCINFKNILTAQQEKFSQVVLASPPDINIMVITIREHVKTKLIQIETIIEEMKVKNETKGLDINRNHPRTSVTSPMDIDLEIAVMHAIKETKDDAIRKL